MKIIALNIYGYGKITETEIDANQQFIQFFGENEAGKSTMQSFIHSILFGFPTRKEPGAEKGAAHAQPVWREDHGGIPG